MAVFIMGTPVEDNAALECIHTAAATYGRKIFQPYKYKANEYGTKQNGKDTHPKNTSSCIIKGRRLLSLSFSALSEQYMFQN